MNKKNIFSIVIFGLLIVGISYFFMASSSDTKKLEITFIADHPICEEGANLPAEMSLFSSVFEIGEQSINYYPSLQFKRIDIDAPLYVIGYSKAIDEETSLEDANAIYGDETPFIKASATMFSTENGLEKMKSIEEDTVNTLYFYLLPKGDINVDNKFIFDSPSVLKKQITHRMEKNELFTKNQKENKITVLLLSQMPEKGEINSNNKTVKEEDKTETITNLTKEDKSNVKTEVKVTTPVKVEKKEEKVIVKQKEEVIVKPTPPTPKPIIVAKKSIDAKIKTKGNYISWNPDLKTADKLVIKFTSEVDKKVLVNEVVTGKSDFNFAYHNSIYEESNIRIEIIGTWSNGSTITNSTKTVGNLECH